MSPHIIGPGLFLVTQGTYGDIMVKELVCRLRVLGSAIYVHCAQFNRPNTIIMLSLPSSLK